MAKKGEMIFSKPNAHNITGHLWSKDRTKLFYRFLRAPSEKAAVVLIHGFGEHSGRYFHVIEKLIKHGFSVFCIDLRGHGHSEGVRGDVASFAQYEDDVLSAIEHIRPENDKLFILAHSMGALIILRLLSRQTGLKIEGMVLSCPLFALRMSIPPWKKWASLAAARLTPRVRVSSGIKGSYLSSDVRLANAYDNDPLVLRDLSIRAFREIYCGYQKANYLAQKISTSFLMQVAGADPVVNSEASMKWFNQINSMRVDATLKIYPDFLHEIYNEANRKEAIGDLISWLDKRS